MNQHRPDDAEPAAAPPANRGLLVVAAVLLAIPLVALLWVGSYTRVEPRVAGFPFFIWYQFLWVFICSGMTWGAYRVIQIARPRPGARNDSGGGSR